MKIVRSLVRASTAVACGALVLSVLGGDAMAAKRPPILWPNGAKLVVQYYAPNPLYTHIDVAWPIASGADHYRVTVVQKGQGAPRVYYDQSPVANTVTALTIYGPPPGDYMVTVTAYSDPDETAAYSESLQARVTAYYPRPIPAGY
jgi:hypothetical protein